MLSQLFLSRRIRFNTLTLICGVLLCFLQTSLQAEENNLCAAPVVHCFDIKPTSVKITWNYSADFAPYEVRINGGAWENPNFSGNTHSVTGLSIGDIVEAEVRSTLCTDQIGFDDCEAKDCPLIFASIATEAISCFGANDGAVQLTPNAGTAPFEFVFGEEVNETGYFENLGGGPKSVWLEDAEGCVSNINLYFFEPTEIQVQTQVLQHIDCQSSEGIANAEVLAGGIGNLSYAWSDGSTSENLSVSNPGTYGLTVSDNNACETSTGIVIEDNNLPELSLNGTEAVCFGKATGTLIVSGENFVENFDYQWSENVAEANNNSANNLGAGIYSVTISNDAACTEVLSAEIQELPEIVLTAEVEPAKCEAANGTISLNASDAEESYSYLWNDAAQQTTSSVTDLPAGNYSVTATSADGCIGTLDVNVSETPKVEISAFAEAVNCFGGADGTAQLNILSGTAPYNINWSNTTTDELLTEIPAGEYTVTVTDAYDCIAETSVVVESPEPIRAEKEIIAPLCNDSNDASVTILAEGGTGELMFALNSEDFFESNTFTDLSPGVYSGIIRDENNCILEVENVTIEAPEPLEVEISLPQEIYYGSVVSPGVQVQGGTGALSFLWSGVYSDTERVSCTDCMQPDVTVKEDGILKLEVEDENSCSVQISYPITFMRAESIFIPSAFSPNADNFNDTFKPEGNDFVYIDFIRVYGRSGNLVYEAKETQLSDLEGWNGEFRGVRAGSGTYAYVLSGKSPEGKDIRMQGEVGLFR